MTTPYIPAGCTQQGRQHGARRATVWPYTGIETEPAGLTEAELDAHNREMHARVGHAPPPTPQDIGNGLANLVCIVAGAVGAAMLLVHCAAR